jgi:hypothetical protein
MQDSDPEINGISWRNGSNFAVNCYLTGTLNNKPMLGTLCVALVREALARVYPDALDLMSIGFLEHFIPTPGAIGLF